MMIQGTLMVVCIDIIRKYIFEKKGVLVDILPPVGEKQEELFITALNIACAYFNIEL